MEPFAFRPRLLSTLKSYNRKTLMADIMAGVIVGNCGPAARHSLRYSVWRNSRTGHNNRHRGRTYRVGVWRSKVQIGGPTGAFIIIIYGIIQQYGMEGLAIATLMAGAFLILFGLLRLGVIIKYIPYPHHSRASRAE